VLIKKLLISLSMVFLATLLVGSLLGYWPHFIIGSYAFMSMITLLVYKWDKRLATNPSTQTMRVPERSLHILAILCGWPGALIAQQWFRHKSKKRAFIFVLWVTIFINSGLLGYLYTQTS
jgi:uncharacterized membrane protein YsdA (DUF1294 family)